MNTHTHTEKTKNTLDNNNNNAGVALTENYPYFDPAFKIHVFGWGFRTNSHATAAAGATAARPKLTERSFLLLPPGLARTPTY